MHDLRKKSLLLVDRQPDSPALRVLEGCGFDVVLAREESAAAPWADAVIYAVHAGNELPPIRQRLTLEDARQRPVIYLVDDSKAEIVAALSQYTAIHLISMASSPAFWKASIQNALSLAKSHQAASHQIDTERGHREALLNAIYQQSPIGIELYDAGGCLLEQNPVCLDIFGIEEPAASRHFCLFDDPNIPDGYKAALRRGESIQLRARFNFEQVGTLYHYQSTRKGSIWLDRFFSPVKDAQNAIQGYMVHIQDITERKRMEEQLRRESRHHTLLMQTSRDAIHVLDQDGKLVDWNEAFLTQLGITAREAATLRVSDWDVRWTTDELIQQIHRNLDQPRVFETRHRRKDGTIIDVEITSASFELEDQKYLYNSARNITRRKQAESELRASEARFRSLFEQSHDAVFFMDLECRHVLANQRAAEMLGYTLDETLKLSMYNTSAEIEESIKVIARLLAGEHIPVYPRLFRKKNGEIFLVEINMELIRDENRQPLYIQSMVRDISFRSKKEE